MAHSGSWYGLPDFGITEKIGSLFNRPTTAQGGSNIFGSNYVSTPNITSNPVSYYTPPQYSSGGAVLGQQTSSGGNNLANMPSQNVGDPYAKLNNASQEQRDAELDALNTEYDYLASQANNQLADLGRQRDTSLASLQTQLSGVKSQVGKSKENAQYNQEQQIDQAGDIARQTQRTNRNTLRALGILDSSAAGELLTRPMTEFDKQRATVVYETTRRLSELDDFMTQKTDEHANLVSQLENQYLSLVGNIQNDLRFNERQRKDSIKAVNAALSQRLSEIGMAQQNYKNQVEAQKAQLASQLQGLGNWNAPVANTSQIAAANAGTLGQKNQTASIYQPEQKKKTTDFQDTYLPYLSAAINAY